jgi:hypothetical protein
MASASPAMSSDRRSSTNALTNREGHDFSRVDGSLQRTAALAAAAGTRIGSTLVPAAI